MSWLTGQQLVCLISWLIWSKYLLFIFLCFQGWQHFKDGCRELFYSLDLWKSHLKLVQGTLYTIYVRLFFVFVTPLSQTPSVHLVQHSIAWHSRTSRTQHWQYCAELSWAVWYCIALCCAMLCSTVLCDVVPLPQCHLNALYILLCCILCWSNTVHTANWHTKIQHNKVHNLTTQHQHQHLTAQ